jgi:hypothetical protein
MVLLVDPDARLDGSAVAVTPLGVPSTERETVPVYPPPRASDTVTVPSASCSTLRAELERETEMVKLSPSSVGEFPPSHPERVAATVRTTPAALTTHERFTGTSMCTGSWERRFRSRTHPSGMREREMTHALRKEACHQTAGG